MTISPFRPWPLVDPADVAALPRPEHPAVLFHTTSRFGHGHTARSLRIARELVRQARCDAFVVAPDADLDGGGLAGVHRLSFPRAVPLDQPDWGQHPILIGAEGEAVPAAELPARWSALLAALGRHLRPRAVLIDQFPMSVARNVAECVEMLSFLRQESPQTLRCAGFRGVQRYRKPPEEEAAIVRLLEEYIDVLFVHVDERERDGLLREHRFLAALESRLAFTGYVAPPPCSGEAEPRRALATFGSGIDAYPKLRLACEGFLHFAARHPGWRLDVVTGDRFPEAARRDIDARYGAAPGVTITDFVPGLAERLGRYALVLAMGGYATCVELYQSGARSIVIPRDEPRDNEQVGEARKFVAYGAIDRVLDAAATTPADLAQAIEDVLASPRRERVPIDVNGAAATAAILAKAVVGGA